MLWPRVSDAADTIPLSHVDLLDARRGRAFGIAGDQSRAETLLEHRAR